MRFLKFLFSFSRQDTNNNVQNQNVTLWCNESFNNQELMTRVQWIEGGYSLRATNLEFLKEYLDVVSFLETPQR